MNFNREKYLAQIKPGVVVDDTGIIDTMAFIGEYYELALVHYLTPDENQGGHGIYVDVLDGKGRPLVNPTDMVVGWTWDGKHDDEPAPAAVFEKKPPEPGANIAIFLGQTATIWIANRDGTPVACNVHGFRTNLPGDGSGNRPGHNSFYVVFRPVSPVQPPVTGQPPTTPPGNDVMALIAELQARDADKEHRLQLIERLINAKG